jgi:UDP:flavonoid glycosyltransferase YjiC (YdhE family)
MEKSIKPVNKGIIGFFPLFYNLAETGRAILISKQIRKYGFQVVFFSHGGEYERLLNDINFDIIRVNPIYNKNIIDKIIKINRGEQKGLPYTEEFLREAVKNEIKAFIDAKIDMVVSFVNLPTSISSRVAKIPYVTVSPAPGNFYMKVPDNYDNNFTKYIPQFIKLPILNYLFHRSKKFLKPFNKIAKEYSLKPFKSTIDIVYGDFNIATNFLDFINVFPNQQIFADKDYVGIISLEKIFENQFSKNKKDLINEKIKKHLSRKGKSILITMGSSGDKNFLLKILDILNGLDYNVIAVYANILDEKKIPKYKKNILTLKFVPSIEDLHKIVDLSIIHGGQGTVYATAYSGKPFIGFPMQFEQHLNIEKLVGHNTGIMLSRKYFNEKIFKKSILEIFDNYQYYLVNAKSLSEKLPNAKGDRKAAERIIEIYNNNKKD